ncbi:MAG: glutamate racemase [bacterium]|nr:glutamate racemase [bacterium]
MYYKNCTSLPIGVFDSGVGGLTVLAALRRKLPDESYIYLGDTARVPYGSKSATTVEGFALQIGAWLALQPVKAIVVACNTASAFALPKLREALPVPIFGVVQPGAAAAVSLAKTRIGVLATRGTIISKAYETAIQRIQPSMDVVSQAAPLLVPLVEEGELTSPIVRLAIENYLTMIRTKHCDTLLLGCTHYPLLKPILAEMLPDITIIDSAEATAAVVATELAVRQLRVDALCQDNEPQFTIAFTDTGGNTVEIAERFLGEPLPHIVTVTIEMLEAAAKQIFFTVRLVQ